MRLSLLCAFSSPTDKTDMFIFYLSQTQQNWEKSETSLDSKDSTWGVGGMFKNDDRKQHFGIMSFSAHLLIRDDLQHRPHPTLMYILMGQPPCPHADVI